MSACPIPVSEPPDRPGFYKLRRGLAEEGMSPGERVYNYLRLVACVGGDAAWIWVMLHERASMPHAPEYLKPDFALIKSIFKRGTTKWLLAQFRRLTEAGIWAEDPKRRFYFKPLPEMIDPSPGRVKPIAAGRGSKKKPMGHAAVTAPSDVAAFKISNREATNGQAVEQPAGRCEEFFGRRDRPVDTESGRPGNAHGDPDGRSSAGGAEPAVISGAASRPVGDADGNIFPDPDAAGDGIGRVECPTCHGRGYIERGAGDGRSEVAEIYFPPGEMDFPPSEMDFGRNTEKCLGSNDLQPAKKILDFGSRSKQGACFNPGDGWVIQMWLSWEEWSHITNDRRKLLTDEELGAVLGELKICRYTDVEFVAEMQKRNITISPDRKRIVGLLRTLIRALPPRPYSAGDRPTGPLDAKGPRPPG